MNETEMQAENELDAAAQRLRSSERGVAVKAERSGKGVAPG